MHKYLVVQLVTYPLVIKSKNAFDEDDVRGLFGEGLILSTMGDKVIDRHFTRLSEKKGADVAIGDVPVQSIGVVEVVVFGIRKDCLVVGV